MSSRLKFNQCLTEKLSSRIYTNNRAMCLISFKPTHFWSRKSISQATCRPSRWHRATHFDEFNLFTSLPSHLPHWQHKRIGHSKDRNSIMVDGETAQTTMNLVIKQMFPQVSWWLYRYKNLFVRSLNEFFASCAFSWRFAKTPNRKKSRRIEIFTEFAN